MIHTLWEELQERHAQGVYCMLRKGLQNALLVRLARPLDGGRMSKNKVNKIFQVLIRSCFVLHSRGGHGDDDERNGHLSRDEPGEEEGMGGGESREKKRGWTCLVGAFATIFFCTRFFLEDRAHEEIGGCIREKQALFVSRQACSMCNKEESMACGKCRSEMRVHAFSAWRLLSKRTSGRGVCWVPAPR